MRHRDKREGEVLSTGFRKTDRLRGALAVSRIGIAR
jgi:hypothetical protein